MTTKAQSILITSLIIAILVILFLATVIYGKSFPVTQPTKESLQLKLYEKCITHNITNNKDLKQCDILK
jgi:predicted neutral ceramidase superfamily lipid hydrolase